MKNKKIIIKKMKNFEPKQTNDSLSILVPKILRLLEKDEQ
jgi:hypothetical protein